MTVIPRYHFSYDLSRAIIIFFEKNYECYRYDKERRHFDPIGRATNAKDAYAWLMDDKEIEMWTS